MVSSNLDREIIYDENKDISVGDIKEDNTMYLLQKKDVKFKITLGNENFKFIKKNIIYVPIYLIHQNKAVSKIGVYEYSPDDTLNILDEDGDYKLELMNRPLFFSFVDNGYLDKYKTNEDSEYSEDSEYNEDSEEEEDNDISSDESIELIDTDEEDDEDEEDQEDQEDEEDEGDEEDDGDEEDEEDEDEDEDEGEEDDKNENDESDNEELIDIDTEPEVLSLDLIQKEYKDMDVLPKVSSIINELYEEDSESDDEKESDDDVKDKIQKKSDKGETYEISQDIKNKFIASSKKYTNWIQQYFKNPYYELENNEGGGDCFFHVIREAFKSIGKNISVLELRTILANEVTEDLFQGFKKLFDTITNEEKGLKREMLKIKQENEKIKKEIKSTTPEKKRVLIDLGIKNNAKYEEVQREYEYSKENLNEFRFMEGIDTIDKLRDVIKTCKFWAETWAISTIERVLNIKIIILSSSHYRQGDYNNILQCGQLNDPILQEKQVFKPKYYIMAEWKGYHYMNILYKGRKIMTYDQIPFDIKELIVDKCLERNSGPYYLIPRFKKLKEKKVKKTATIDKYEDYDSYEDDNEGTEMSGSEYETSGSESDMETEEHNISSKKLTPVFISLDGDEISIKEGTIITKTKSKTKSKYDKPTELLYDPNIIFQYYERSADTKPGKGTGEMLSNDKNKTFIKLNKYKNWRRKLSNFYFDPFVVDGKKWSSIEHYMQAMKFKKNNNDTYLLFSLDRPSQLSADSKIARIVGETGIYEGERIFSTSEVKPDPDYEENKREYMFNAMKSKFSVPVLGEILRETQNAKLVIYVPKNKPIVANTLMRVRKYLLDSDI